MVNHFTECELKSIGCYITTAEMAAIEKCKINLNDDYGIYSDEYMSLAIANLGELPLRVVVQDSALPLYQKYHVEVECRHGFFE